MCHHPLINLVNMNYPALLVAGDLWEAVQLFDRMDSTVLPVVQEEIFVGLLYREDLENCLNAGANKTIRQLTTRQVVYLSPENTVEEALELFHNSDQSVVPVIWAGGYFAGMLQREVVERYVK